MLCAVEEEGHQTHDQLYDIRFHLHRVLTKVRLVSAFCITALTLLIEKVREQAMERYNSTCVVTGCRLPFLLEAAHIKPYLYTQQRYKSDSQKPITAVVTIWFLYVPVPLYSFQNFFFDTILDIEKAEKK